MFWVLYIYSENEVHIKVVGATRCLWGGGERD